LFPTVKVRAVCQALAVSALPCKLPIILELNVLLPANVYAPVVTTPLALALALGITASLLAILFTVVLMLGPAVVPPVQVLATVVVAFVAEILPSVSEIFEMYSPVPPPTAATSKV
jgi:hypothetical protein